MWLRLWNLELLPGVYFLTVWDPIKCLHSGKLFIRSHVVTELETRQVLLPLGNIHTQLDRGHREADLILCCICCFSLWLPQAPSVPGASCHQHLRTFPAEGIWLNCLGHSPIHDRSWWPVMGLWSLRSQHHRLAPQQSPWRGAGGHLSGKNTSYISPWTHPNLASQAWK